MPLNSYLSNCTGKKQGKIDGSCTQKGFEKMIRLNSVHSECVAPRDAASGLATGKRRHLPLFIEYDYDRSVPYFYNALTGNETITKLKIEFYSATKIGHRGSGESSHVLTYTIELENAHVSEMSFRQPSTVNPATMQFENYVRVGFTFQKITGTWKDGGVGWADDWESFAKS